MRIFDFAIQTLLIITALICLIFGTEGLILIMVIQLLTGGWQLLSALLTAANNRHKNRARTKTTRIYWISVFVYFAGLSLVYFMKDKWYLGVWFFSAWGLAIYYYVLTIRLAFAKNNKRETFLDMTI